MLHTGVTSIKRDIKDNISVMSNMVSSCFITELFKVTNMMSFCK